MSYYCSQVRANEPNREVVYAMLDDIRCVIDKSYGMNDRINGDCTQLLNECDQLREAVTSQEAANADCERTIQELNNKIQQLQFCLDEQCQSRENCEAIIRDLRGQLDRQDENLNCTTAEKADLNNEVRLLEVDAQNLRNQVCDLEAERADLAKQLTGYEPCQARNLELQNALRECCQKCDELQQEVLEWKKCAQDANLQLETCNFEKSKLQNELDFTRQLCAQEKEQMEGQICQLASGVASLEQNKQEVCQKMNEILKAHHEEMDNLKNGADDYKKQLEDCRKAREELEKKLRSAGREELEKNQKLEARGGELENKLKSETKTREELGKKLQSETKSREELGKKLKSETKNREQLVKKLTIEVEAREELEKKLQLEVQARDELEQQIRLEAREELETKLRQAKWNAEREVKKMTEDMKTMEAEMSTWKNLAKMKNRMELEFIELKRAINEQFIDKRDVEKLKTAYERKIADIKTQFEHEIQQKVSETFMKQTRDRQVIEKIRDVNENTIRSELTSMTRTLQLDTDRLKGIIRERDEQIISLRKSLDIVKEKYADESRHRESLLKKLQIISSHSLETVSISPLKTPLIPGLVASSSDTDNRNIGLAGPGLN